MEKDSAGGLTELNADGDSKKEVERKAKIAAAEEKARKKAEEDSKKGDGK